MKLKSNIKKITLASLIGGAISINGCSNDSYLRYQPLDNLESYRIINPNYDKDTVKSPLQNSHEITGKSPFVRFFPDNLTIVNMENNDLDSKIVYGIDLQKGSGNELDRVLKNIPKGKYFLSLKVNNKNFYDITKINNSILFPKKSGDNLVLYTGNKNWKNIYERNNEIVKNLNDIWKISQDDIKSSNRQIEEIKNRTNNTSYLK